LSTLERRSFVSFLGLYLGSSFALIIIIAVLYYDTVSGTMVQMRQDAMKSHGAQLAFAAIGAHMHRQPFDYRNDTPYSVGMYSSARELLYGEEIEGADFNSSVYTRDDTLYVIDRSAQLHMGVKYIVLRDRTIFGEVAKLRERVVIYTLFTLLLVGAIGYILGRLFLRPIANERERLDRFIKDTTHELNTPISALLMSISALGGEESRAKERIRLSAGRISAIYDDLCYLLRDERGGHGEVTELDLREIVTEQLALLEGYARSKRIEIVTSLESLTVVIDPESARRLVGNILGNALKYSRPNTTVEVTLAGNALTVTDHGIGVDPGELSRIQNRYYRADNSEGGFGIGLDIVSTICKRYGIGFEIESVKGEGTRVRLVFGV